MRNNKAYGIYLGVEYASMAYAENGIATSVKMDVTEDVMPCCIYVNSRGFLIVGRKAQNCAKAEYNRTRIFGNALTKNAFFEFTRTLGTDKKYICSNMDGREYSSEELSAEVLKTLKSFVTDEDFKSVVITVPPKFTVNQKTATIKAAQLAGFNHVELLQKPIAAAMAYGLTSAQKDGYWLVFDFGGGAFYAALIKVEDGIIQVFDTEGDNYLGGKNLDYAIVDNILMPYLQENYSIDGFLADPIKKDILREAMKTYAEEIKNELSFKDSYSIYVDPEDLGEDEDGEEFEIDLTITKDEVYSVIRPLFQKAVDICKDLLKRNNLTSQQLGKLILVGGPTRSPLVRQMLKEQVSPNVDSSINPMTAVAEGAALYASTIDNEIREVDLQSLDVVLEINFDSMTVDTDIWVPVSLKSGADSVMVQFVRSDNAWDSGKTEVDHNGNVVELNLVEGQPNSFRVECYDHQGSRLNCFPNEITIIQGSKVGNATLPYDVCTSSFNEKVKLDVCSSILGLGRGCQLPCVSVMKGFVLPCNMIPGDNEIYYIFSILQSDSDCNGRPVYLSWEVGRLEITGEDVPFPIYKGSKMDITLRIDRKEQISYEVYFPEIDITIVKDLKILTPSNKSVQTHISIMNLFGKYKLASLPKGIVPPNDIIIIKGAELMLDEMVTPMSVCQHMKESLRKIEDLAYSQNSIQFEKCLSIEFYVDHISTDLKQWIPFKLASKSDRKLQIKLVRHDLKWISETADLNELGDVIQLERISCGPTYFHVFCLDENDEIVKCLPSIIKL